MSYAFLDIVDGEPVRVTSRRDSIVAPARIDAKLRAGLVLMTFHFLDGVDTNALLRRGAPERSPRQADDPRRVRVEQEFVYVAPRAGLELVIQLLDATDHGLRQRAQPNQRASEHHGNLRYEGRA